MRLLACLACTASVALGSAAVATSAPRMYLGFLDDLSLRYEPARATTFDAVRQARATVVRSLVRWNEVAPRRPGDAADPRDPAYLFADLDELVVNAQQRGLEVLLTIWGTPGWANGGGPPDVPPTDASDLGDFAHALAARYSGAFPDHPFVRFFSIWNEPNSPRFLEAPDPPAAYARLAAAAYAGIKSGSPQASVAVGETAASHAPAAFMAAVARANPQLPFDAWSHHPYPPTATGSPSALRRWPDVGLREVDRFGAAIDEAFGRRDTPLWLTEYAESKTAVPVPRLAADVSEAIRLARDVPRVVMFIWLMLHDHPGEPWQSGLVGTPALRSFGRAATTLDPRNALSAVDTRRLAHAFRVPALELKWHLVTGSRVGLNWRLAACGRTLQSAAIAARIGRDGWVSMTLDFHAAPGVRYVLELQLEDVHGFGVRRTLGLVGVGPPGRGADCAPRPSVK